MHRTLDLRPVAVRTILFVLALCIAGGVTAKSSTAGLIDALQARLQALSQGDRQAWSRRTTEDAFFVDANGTFLNRTAMTEGFAKGYPDVFGKVHNVRTRGSKADVVVSYAVEEVETFPSGPITRTIHRTETWVRQDGRWQMASGQATIVPQMRWNTVAVGAKLLDQYVGQYQWYPGKVDTVSREGNKLYSQWTGEEQKEELLAINDSTFFVRDDSPLVIFVRDRKGRVTHYLLRGWDGQSLSARKID